MRSRSLRMRLGVVTAMADSLELKNGSVIKGKFIALTSRRPEKRRVTLSTVGEQTRSRSTLHRQPMRRV